ncbi:single-stranded DNA-binding protein [Micromonospora sp. LOL_024]|uniref:single-stranded DNA-binding protein n=1 Tax=Micromonospora sp. LOL_024 TaxID=3345412 RepID=UPI003A878AC8
MFDTNVTIVGNVLTAPEWRRTTQSNTLVANFKVASTARRLDRDSGRWVDGNSLRVRVNCWRKLAEGVAASVAVGDPVVVCGRLYTRDWTDDAGNHRTLYELEAVAVGHDLSRGRGRFLRNRPSLATSAVTDAEAADRVHGEPTEPVPDDQVPARLDDGPLDDDFELPDPTPSRVGRSDGLGDEQGWPDGAAPASGAETRPVSGGDELLASEDLDQVLDAEQTASVVLAASDGSTPARAVITVPEEGLAVGPEESGADVAVTGRGRRGRGRLPQPA